MNIFCLLLITFNEIIGFIEAIHMVVHFPIVLPSLGVLPVIIDLNWYRLTSKLQVCPNVVIDAMVCGALYILNYLRCATEIVGCTKVFKKITRNNSRFYVSNKL